MDRLGGVEVERSPRMREGDRGSISGRHRPNSIIQVVTALLQNAPQQVRVSRVL